MIKFAFREPIKARDVRKPWCCRMESSNDTRRKGWRGKRRSDKQTLGLARREYSAKAPSIPAI